VLLEECILADSEKYTPSKFIGQSQHGLVIMVWNPSEITVLGIKIKQPLFLMIGLVVVGVISLLCIPMLFFSGARLVGLIIMLFGYVAAGALIGYWFYETRKSSPPPPPGRLPSQVSGIDASFHNHNE
jgi:hypothetical protein